MGRLESDIQKETRLALSQLGVVNFRNNVGRLQDQAGRWVEFGLCVGSSDLIGWRTVTVTQQMVGRKVAVFTAVETKRGRGAKVTIEQRHFISMVLEAGGIAGICASAKEALEVVRRWMA